MRSHDVHSLEREQTRLFHHFIFRKALLGAMSLIVGDTVDILSDAFPSSCGNRIFAVRV